MRFCMILQDLSRIRMMIDDIFVCLIVFTGYMYNHSKPYFITDNPPVNKHISL